MSIGKSVVRDLIGLYLVLNSKQISSFFITCFFFLIQELLELVKSSFDGYYLRKSHLNFGGKTAIFSYQAKMFLFKPSNSSTSQPVDFYFYPDRKNVQTKRTKNVTSGLSQTTLNPTLKDLIQKSSPVQTPPVL